MSFMNRAEFLKLMEFPGEWELWNMIPPDWLSGAMEEYRPGQEESPEHYRNGAFHWWIRSEPSKQDLITLARLSLIDPEQIMAVEDWQVEIRKATNFCEEVETALGS